MCNQRKLIDAVTGDKMTKNYKLIVVNKTVKTEEQHTPQ
jgi:hypothetical protein